MVISIVVMIVIGFLYYVSQRIVIHQFHELELKLAGQTAEDILRSYELAEEKLGTFVKDWASWDDAYDFAEDGNEEFIRENFVDETFIAQQLTFMMMLNARGEVVYGKGFDLKNEEIIDIPPATLAALLNSPLVFDQREEWEGTQGTLQLPEGFVMAASRPVRTSNDEGPVRGTLIMAAALSDAAFAKIIGSGTTLVTLHVDSDDDLPEIVRSTPLKMDQRKSVIVAPVDDELIDVFAIYRPLAGDASMVAHIKYPRDVLQHGKRAASELLIWLILGAIVLGVLFYIMLQTLVLSRLQRLNSEINTIGKAGIDHNHSIDSLTQPGDELGNLAESLNGMVDSVRRSEAILESRSYILENIASGVGAQKVLQLITRQVEEMCPYWICAITILNEDNTALSVLASPSLPVGLLTAIEASAVGAKGGASALACLTHKPVVLQSPADDPACENIRVALKEAGIQTWWSEPIPTADSLSLGTFDVFVRQAYTPDKQAREIVLTASRLARIVIERKRSDTKERELERQLRHKQKMEAIGTLAGGVAHDFNNNLAALQLYIELVQKDLPEDCPSQDNLAGMLRITDRSSALTHQILAFSRHDDQQRRPVKLADLIEEATQLLRPALPSTIEICTTIDTTNDTVLADETQMHQVIVNICTNGAQSMEHGGTLSITLTSRPINADDPPELQQSTSTECVELTIADTGHGVDPKILERIFEPFFTTRAFGKGTGMGLAVAHGIVTQHGGSIQVQSRLGQGTQFRILIPGSEEEATPKAKDDSVAGGNAHVLFIDDEVELLNAGSQALRFLGYKVTAFSDSKAALEAFQREPRLFDAVITDQTMPGMTGDALALEILKTHPDTPIVLSTGFSESMSAEHAYSIGIQVYLEKPVSLSDYARALRDVLSSPADVSG